MAALRGDIRFAFDKAFRDRLGSMSLLRQKGPPFPPPDFPRLLFHL